MPLYRAVLLSVLWSGRDFDLNHYRAVNWTLNCCFVVPMLDIIFVPIPIQPLAMVTPSWSSSVLVRRNAALSRYQPLDQKRKWWRFKFNTQSRLELIEFNDKTFFRPLTQSLSNRNSCDATLQLILLTDLISVPFRLLFFLLETHSLYGLNTTVFELMSLKI